MNYILIDEFRTSKLHYNTEVRCTNMRVIETDKDVRKRLEKKKKISEVSDEDIEKIEK